MDFGSGNTLEYQAMNYSEKNHDLLMRQKVVLDLFLERRAITKADYDRGLKAIEAMERNAPSAF